MKTIKKGSKGPIVSYWQEFLKNLQLYNYKVDEYFGNLTHKSTVEFQRVNGLVADGIVGPATWDCTGLSTTDNSERTYETSNGLIINKHFLPKGEYKSEITNKEYVFIHHTAGWHNPYKCIDSWGRDSRGSICTEFVLGGQSVKGNDDTYDGVMVQAFPDGHYGWHLGKNGSQHMHTHSVGIEVCNFGYIKDGKTYAGTRVAESEIVELDKPFRGFKYWHRYSDLQIEQLRLWLHYIAERDGIDIRKGLVEEIKKNGADGFEFNEDAYYGRVKGLWTHTNTRKDKFDMFPQQELLDMLVNL